MQKNTKETIYNKLEYNKLKGPVSVAFTITRDCNFRCIHCFNESGELCNMSASLETLLNIAEQIVMLEPLNVCLCGGETLMDFNKALEVVRYLAPKVGNVNLVSNGFLVTEEKLKLLKEAGLNTIQISLDGDNEFTHDNMRGMSGAFKKAVNAIKIAKETGLNVAVSFVPQKLNYKYLGNACDLCFELGVSEFRAMPLIPMGRGGRISPLLLSSEEYLKLQRIMEEKKYEYEFKMNVQWGDPIDHLYRMPVNNKLKLNTYSMEVSFDGDITVTTYLPISVGNCLKNDLLEYWEAGYKNIWGNKEVLQYTNEIETIYDFASPIFANPIYLDILDKKLKEKIS